MAAPTTVHMVYLKTKEEVTPEQVQTLFIGNSKSLEAVPGVLRVKCGTNFSQRNRGFNVGLMVEFESAAHCAAYATHELHVAYLGHLDGLIADVMAVDFTA
eukprot:TRINITY_DN3670_c0_g1_i1.p1 TRINITY_DN3670_c0_g1~~TRINITY_DN3670_c0_g1_i1.p1  ORF type:complete len:101 (-),score=18.34 TRINITY_DN3670_c0_g1_i1:68-370(-)